MIETFPILQTKLCRSPTPMEFVPKSAFLDRLARHRGIPLTLVSAPAGYAKSTFVSSWLESLDCPAAWLSLSEHDNDLEVILDYFLACVQTLLPDAIDETAALIGIAGDCLHRQ